MKPFRPDELPHRPAYLYLGRFQAGLWECLALVQYPCKDPVVLLWRVIDPAGEHPVEDLVISGPFDFRDPPDAPLWYSAYLPLPVLVHSPVEKWFPERGSNALEDPGHIFRQAGVIEDDRLARLQPLHVEQGLV